MLSPFFTGHCARRRGCDTFAHECFLDEGPRRADRSSLRCICDDRLMEVIRAAQRRPIGTAAFTTTATGAPACEGQMSAVATKATTECRDGRGGCGVERANADAARRSSDCGPISNPDGMKNQIEGGCR
jgi:hypothetical protein